MEPIAKPTRSPKTKPNWLKRLGWLVAIWALSILALAIVSFGLKFVMRAVGFHI